MSINGEGIRQHNGQAKSTRSNIRQKQGFWTPARTRLKKEGFNLLPSGLHLTLFLRGRKHVLLVTVTRSHQAPLQHAISSLNSCSRSSVQLRRSTATRTLNRSKRQLLQILTEIRHVMERRRHEVGCRYHIYGEGSCARYMNDFDCKLR